MRHGMIEHIPYTARWPWPKVSYSPKGVGLWGSFASPTREFCEVARRLPFSFHQWTGEWPCDGVGNREPRLISKKTLGSPTARKSMHHWGFRLAITLLYEQQKMVDGVFIDSLGNQFRNAQQHDIEPR